MVPARELNMFGKKGAILDILSLFDKWNGIHLNKRIHTFILMLTGGLILFPPELDLEQRNQFWRVNIYISASTAYSEHIILLSQGFLKKRNQYWGTNTYIYLSFYNLFRTSFRMSLTIH